MNQYLFTAIFSAVTLIVTGLMGNWGFGLILILIFVMIGMLRGEY